MAINIPSSTVNSRPANEVDGTATFPLLQLVKIDVSLLINPSSPEGNEELNKLRIALAIYGCFQAVNHGLENSIFDELYDVTKMFFSLPLEEKQKYYSSRPAGDFESFGNDQLLVGNQKFDGNDRLYLSLYPEDERRLKSWPENPKEFRKILLEYRAKLKKLNELILKAMAKSLNLEENCFLKKYGESPTVLSRFDSYSPCPGPEITLAAKSHSDASALTFFIQDKEVESLQILLSDQWFKFPIIDPQAILVNIGDQVEIMTNGIFKSPIHRFVPTSKTERITTISTFFTPDKGCVIEPAEGLIDEKRPRLYKQVVDYAGFFFHEYYNKGNRVIDALKI
ncbi:hypothetical protein ACH5RR_005793 [Cinchona calisaya]|uniref:Fe2OG dioxygenase domain-containing protein n=1 Tax=Cinchona calisaya TaxID=153742 RepID=A0ABD3AMB5_9GENT